MRAHLTLSGENEMRTVSGTGMNCVISDDSSEMEISPVAGLMPMFNFRFGGNPRCFSMRTAPPSPCFPYASLGNLSCYTERPGSESPNRMFILGMGFVGQFFAAELRSQGWIVSGTCTSKSKKKKLEDLGYDVYVFDADGPDNEIRSIMKYHSHLLVSIPPVVGIGDLVLQHGDLLKNSLKGGNLRWLAYFSSTSVYGDCGGEWVDEDYPINPTSKLAQARLAAEEGWLKLGSDLGLSTQIFRLGGIYGPGRSAVDTIMKQESLSESQRLRSSKQYTSRVHVADICQALHASIFKQSPPGRIYNIVDDDPASRIEVFSYARELIEKKWPGRIMKVKSADDDMAEESHKTLKDGSSKRVSNGRMKKELGVRLLYPNYSSGLQSIIHFSRVDDS